MKRAIKISAFFIGTVIGAGFASGKEIASFFGTLNPISAALGGVVLAILAMLFMFAGKKGLIWQNKLYKFLLLISTIITLSAMFAGSQNLLNSLVPFPLWGLVLGLFSTFIVFLGVEKIKLFNAIIVPLIIIFVVIIFAFEPKPPVGNFGILRPIAYGGLNILLAGDVVANEGKHATTKEIVLSSILIGVFLSIMLFAIQSATYNNTSVMPMHNVASKYGFPIMASILILSAIFTTMVSAQNILAEFLSSINFPQIKKNKAKSLIILVLSLLISYPLSFVGWNNIVQYLYPIISIAGIYSIFSIFGAYFVGIWKDHKAYKNAKINISV